MLEENLPEWKPMSLGERNARKAEGGMRVQTGLWRKVLRIKSEQLLELTLWWPQQPDCLRADFDRLLQMHLLRFPRWRAVSKKQALHFYHPLPLKLFNQLAMSSKGVELKRAFVANLNGRSYIEQESIDLNFKFIDMAFMTRKTDGKKIALMSYFRAQVLTSSVHKVFCCSTRTQISATISCCKSRTATFISISASTTNQSASCKLFFLTLLKYVKQCV